MPWRLHRLNDVTTTLVECFATLLHLMSQGGETALAQAVVKNQTVGNR